MAAEMCQKLSRNPTTDVADVVKQLSKKYTQNQFEEICRCTRQDSPDGGGKRRSPDSSAPIYGELLVLGTNGCLPCPAITSKMSHHYILRKQHRATGVSPITKSIKDDTDSPCRKSTHTVTMKKSESGHSVTEYGPDSRTDLFQIGRSADSAIDFVVVEAVAAEDGTKQFKGNSTVSRYACRIQCERSPPYSARLYAAAFDEHGRIQLSSNAPMWKMSNSEHDGLTTNGIAFMRPTGTFESGVCPGEWREVTVMGNVRKVRAQRSSRTPGEPVPEDTNILTDGCLIDLCGVSLMWRTAIGLEQGPSNTILRDHRRALDQLSPQCPVNLLTLHFRNAFARSPSTAASALSPQNTDVAATEAVASVPSASCEPWVYTTCGHVYSHHEWKARPEENNHRRTCPMCRKVSPYCKLELGLERGFFIDERPLTHAFVPCGHVTTEKTTRYWQSVQIPHLASEWSPRCPFCAMALDRTMPTIKLLFS